MALINCPECGKEISDKASACPNCGCPIGEKTEPKVAEPVAAPAEPQKKKSNKKVVSMIIVIIVIIIAGILIYYISILKPKKIEEQNKATYNEAISLLEKGKYDDGKELLETIEGYDDVDTVLEQIKWESYVYECINEFKTWLKNPDSFTLYDVGFYLDDESHGMYSSLLAEVDYTYPAIIFHSGAQNGFGGNTTGYELFYYVKDKGYSCMGSCDSLNEDDYYYDDGDLKDEDDGAMKVFLCKEINEIESEVKPIGTVDMDRIKTLIKNDSYSTIKIIE